MMESDLLSILDNLKDDEFKDFKWYLKYEKLRDIPPIKVSRLSGAERRDVVDLIVQKYEFTGAVEVIKSILKKISRNDLVEELPNISSGAEAPADKLQMSVEVLDDLKRSNTWGLIPAERNCRKSRCDQDYKSVAAQSQTTLEAKLKALQCHFTWDIHRSDDKLFLLRDKLEDIGTEEGNSWLGHIYNLQGFIHYQLGFTEDAQSFFSRAAEAFQKRNTNSDEGPWLVVNYGNLAWLHHHLREQAESQTYLSKVDALLKEYPSPSQDELHPEIYAEKAWTLKNFGRDKKPLVVDYFKRAIRMQPDVVEWHTSYVMASVNDDEYSDKPLEEDILEKMEIAKEHDPENLYFAALYLEECAKKGRKIEDEVRELAERVLRNPVSSYSGMTPLLRVFRKYVSIGEAIDLAEKALERHLDERHLQKCAATCYKWMIYSDRDNSLQKSTIDRAISLHKEVISLYPHSSLQMKIALANIYAKSSNSQAEADQIYKELLEIDLEPADRQMLYSNYAKHLHFIRHDTNMSIKYHKKTAEIPLQSVYRKNSIRTLRKILESKSHPMCEEIEEFLANLQD